jgi:AmmeMemoRadiSam system protein A
MTTDLSCSADASNSAEPGLEKSTGLVVCAALMAHAPILVPEVGGERAQAARASCQAMREAAACLTATKPDALVLISPHSPRKRRAFGLWSGERLRGSLAQFGAGGAEVVLPNDSLLAGAIKAEADRRDLATWWIAEPMLDHGAVVPLWFLAEAGWGGPTAILSLNNPGDGGLAAMGAAIADAARASRCRVAIVASGDMSHRLAPQSPCGFHPNAHEFDETFIRLLRGGDYHGIENMSPELRELAAEDAADSVIVAASAVDWKADERQVLSYEGPFGVGYGVAVLFAADAIPAAPEPVREHGDKNEGAILPCLARQSISCELQCDTRMPPPAGGPYLSARRGVFVTLRERNGNLRGCCGTIFPVCDNVVAETWRSARSAAFQDRRFDAVQAGELPNLHIDVSVLHSMETICSPDELNPARYGVVVSTEDGRRGLLLPAIAEVKTVGQQLSIARRKAGIGAKEPVKMQRFQVDHFEEAAD